MNYIHKVIVLCSGLLMSVSTLYPITLVYNMRIRRVFALDFPAHTLFSAVPIFYKRTRTISDTNRPAPVCIDEINKIGGTLLNIRYVPNKAWWCELTTGVEKESMLLTGTQLFTASRTGFDDIVCAAGHTIFLSDNAQFGIYGLTGFPTKRRVRSVEEFNTLVGTRFFSIGAGSECSYAFINSLPRTAFVTVQVRGIHFFSRRWDPILPVDAEIQPGDVIDVLCAMRYRERRSIFEAGYNATSFVHQAVRLPELVRKGRNFVRHSIYGTATYIFTQSYLITKPLILGAGLSASWADRFNTRIFVGWINATYVF